MFYLHISKLGEFTSLDDYSRGYVYYDLLREPTLNDIIRAMITAMWQYQTMPKGVVIDNGSHFEGQPEYVRYRNEGRVVVEPSHNSAAGVALVCSSFGAMPFGELHSSPPQLDRS